MVGEIYYIKEVPREIVRMSNGQVLEVNEDYEKIVDEMAAAGVTEEDRRERMDNVVYVRKFDAGGWLDDEQKTVFSYIPLIPTYAEFMVVDSKIIYSGVVERLIDPQRVMNYSMSREIEEGALAPRAKYWMTSKQIEGNEDELETLNTNNSPVQEYNADPEAPGPPQQSGGAMINPGLRTISEGLQNIKGMTAGLHAANMGDNPGLQSGVAIEALQKKGDTGTIEYFEAQEIAICHTARILVDAIPKVYDAQRQVRILSEDGTFEMQTINQQATDQQTGEVVTLNDLSAGKYDVTCSAGPSFQSRQAETVAGMVEVAQVDPSIIGLGGDVLLNNMSAPGMDLIAARKRLQLVNQGAIPEDQLTDEEKQAMQAAAQQPQEPDAMMVAAQAEMAKAQAASEKNQLTMQKQEQDFAIKQQQAELEMQKAQLDLQKAQAKLQLEQQEQMRKDQETAAKVENIDADTINKMIEAQLARMGVTQ
jgi:hypothetical protein